MYFMSLSLTASPEDSVTKLSCYVVKSSTINTRFLPLEEAAFSMFKGSPLKTLEEKILLFRLFSAFDNNTWIGSLFCLCTTALSRLIQGKTINTLTTFGEVNKGNACIFSLRDCKSMSEAKARTLKCVHGSENHHHHNPPYFCICQQILHTDCPPTAHMHEQFLWAPSYFFLPKSVKFLKTSLQAFLK